MNDKLSEILGVAQDAQIIDLVPDQEAPNLPVAVEAVKPPDGQVIEDADFAREMIYDIIDKGAKSIDTIAIIARESMHPRAFEVMAQLLKTQSDNIDKLLKLQKDKKDLLKDDSGGGDTSINIEQGVFVGSTSDLLKKIKSDVSNQ